MDMVLSVHDLDTVLEDNAGVTQKFHYYLALDMTKNMGFLFFSHMSGSGSLMVTERWWSQSLTAPMIILNSWKRVGTTIFVHSDAQSNY